MKRAEDVFNKMCEEMPWNFIGKKEIAPYILEAIKIAQRDAVDEAVKMCAEEATVTYIDLTNGEEFDYTDVITDDDVGANVDKQSILQVADKLKQEIN